MCLPIAPTMPCAAGTSRSRSVLISERRASALYATALNPGRYDFMQKGRSSSEKYLDGAKHPLAAMMGHRLRSEHFEVLTEALPERWVGLLNLIHALPEHGDAQQSDAAALLLNQPARQPG